MRRRSPSLRVVGLAALRPIPRRHWGEDHRHGDARGRGQAASYKPYCMGMLSVNSALPWIGQLDPC